MWNILALSNAAMAALSSNLEDHATTLIGTWSTNLLSTGNTLPLTMHPWGFNSFAMYNKGNDHEGGGAWWFDPNRRYIDGIRLTHQPSPWIGDWGNFMFTWMRDISKHDSLVTDTAAFKPSHFFAETASEGTKNGPSTVRVTASNHGAIIQFKYNPPQEGEFFPYMRNVHLLLPGIYKEAPSEYRTHLNTSFDETTKLVSLPNDGAHANAGDFTTKWPEYCSFDDTTDMKNIIFKCTNRNGAGTDQSGNPFVLFMYGRIVSDQDALAAVDGNTTKATKLHLKDARTHDDTATKRAVVGYNFQYPDTTTMNEIRLATSLISMEQAEANFDMEVGLKTFEEMQTELNTAWNDTLGAVKLHETGLEGQEHEDALTKFYSNLYRAALFPRDLSEWVKDPTTGELQQKHWSAVASCRHEPDIRDPAACKSATAADPPALHDGPFSTDSGFWDAYHTVYALQALAWPERYTETVEGYINHWRENYWIAQWASPSYKSSMVGTMSDNIIADALVKGLVKPESIDDAWNAMISNLPPKEGLTGPMYPPSTCPADQKPACSAGNEIAENQMCKDPISNNYGDTPWCNDGTTKATCEGGATPYCDNWGWPHCDVYASEGYQNDDRCGKYGREGMEEYKTHSYIPADSGVHEDLARTMNYWNSDAAILKAGLLTGKLSPGDPMHDELSARLAAGPPLLFDTETRFFRPKNIDGTWGESGDSYIWNDKYTEWDFDEYSWGKHYTEGGPWHYRFALMHDTQQLASLYGDDLCQVMASIHDQPSIVHHMGYDDTIHEMAELPGNSWGQYLHNNQPGHPQIWTQLKVAMDKGDQACKANAIRYIKKVLNELYTTTTYAGDEDNGEMSAWYVLSSMGLYDLFPGSGEYIVGSPIFKHVEVSAKYPSMPEVSSWSVVNPCPECESVTNVGGTSGTTLSFATVTGSNGLFSGIEFEYSDTTTTTTTTTTPSQVEKQMSDDIASLNAIVITTMVFTIVILLGLVLALVCLKNVKKRTSWMEGHIETIYIDQE